MRSVCHPALGFIAALLTEVALAHWPAPALAQEAIAETGHGHSVTVEGQHHPSSTDEPREPIFLFRNDTDQPRTVILESLVSLGAQDRPGARLALTEARVAHTESPSVQATQGQIELELPPRSATAFELYFEGTPTRAGDTGLSWHRYRLTYRVGGRRGHTVAETSYVCRIPLRR